MDKTKIKYFVYVRKSSESEDRQVQSLDDQKDCILKLATQEKLNIVEVLPPESKSAKSPYNRPVFEDMLERIENGEANGILCWEFNRLSRNSVDSGKLQWMLQQGTIQSIQTISREYKPDDNALLLSVESGSANQFILDLKKGVRRGLNSKLEKGDAPISAPLGYLNSKIENREENFIKVDPERFDVVRKMWDLMLTGNYTPPKILEIVNEEWGFRTRKTKHKGGRPLARSTIYRIFTDPFYAGLFKYRGQTYTGNHTPMISLDEFDRVQLLLGREGKPRPKVHEFPFTGVIQCGECGSAITAIEKTKLIKKTGEIKTFIYYYCTRRKNGTSCTQRASLTDDEIRKQIEREIMKISIIPDFKDWALDILNESNDSEIEQRTKVYEMQQQGLLDTQKELDNLTKMRYRELIDDATFIKERDELKSKLTKLKVSVKETESRADKWLELTEKTFVFALYAHNSFLHGDMQTRREILMTLGQNYTLKDQELLIVPNEWLKPIINKYPAMKLEYDRLELGNNKDTKRRKEALASFRPELRGLVDAVGTRIREHYSCPTL